MMKEARKHQSVIVGMVTLTIYSVENSIRRKCESEQNCWKICKERKMKRKEGRGVKLFTLVDAL